jgi:hypothetical protein
MTADFPDQMKPEYGLPPGMIQGLIASKSIEQIPHEPRQHELISAEMREKLNTEHGLAKVIKLKSPIDDNDYQDHEEDKPVDVQDVAVDIISDSKAV